MADVSPRLPDDLTSDPPPELNNRNRGLTRVYLDWDLRWDTISTDFYDSVDGFAVILHPDQKSVSYPVPDKGLPPFYLPKWVYANIIRMMMIVSCYRASYPG